MRVMFQIEYTNKEGDRVESFSCIDASTEEGKSLLRDTLDEYLSNHEGEGAKFWVGGKCESHKEE